jgi:benzoyl-CoA reductase/2-hydroxyglutaryl-CoA dehydratase subunit BcrC/BadD/HgdB
MNNLSKDWLIESHIDFEYKQFVLLAYLDSIRNQFQKQLLYPSLSDLIEHYNNLNKIRKEIESLYLKFPSEINALDLKEFKISYQKMISNDAVMLELEQIIDFSIPQMKQALEEGKNIYIDLESTLILEPVGIIPLWSEDGYLLIDTFKPKETKVYEYSVSLYTSSNDTFRSLSTKYVTTITNSSFSTAENLKHDLLKQNKNLPNPATYFFRSSKPIPFEESYLPIAKRMLLKELSKEG